MKKNKLIKNIDTSIFFKKAWWEIYTSFSKNHFHMCQDFYQEIEKCY